jgi:hypothetical protein
MTSYTIRLGYQSGYSGEITWEELKALALAIADDPEAICREAVAFGAPTHLGSGSLREAAENYRTREDLTLKFHEADPADEDSEPCIRQSASGGAPYRVLKEHLRRAFCRLLMAEVHRRGAEVSLTVG